MLRFFARAGFGGFSLQGTTTGKPPTISSEQLIEITIPNEDLPDIVMKAMPVIMGTDYTPDFAKEVYEFGLYAVQQALPEMNPKATIAAAYAEQIPEDQREQVILALLDTLKDSFSTDFTDEFNLRIQAIFPQQPEPISNRIVYGTGLAEAQEILEGFLSKDLITSELVREVRNKLVAFAEAV